MGCDVTLFLISSGIPTLIVIFLSLKGYKKVSRTQIFTHVTLLEMEYGEEETDL